MNRVIALASLAVLSSACANDAPTLPEPQAFGGSSSNSVAESRQMLKFDLGIPAGLADQVAAAGGTLEHSLDGIGVVVVSGLDDATVAALGATSAVADQELQFIDAPAAEGEVEAGASETIDSHLSPSTAFFFPRQWHHRAIGANLAWAANVRGSASVTVGILDSGIDYTHPDLNGRVDLARSKNFVNTSIENQLRNFFFPTLNPIIDMNRHGTHVASTVVSNGHTTAGVTQRVTLMAVKVLGVTGSGSTSNVLAGVMHAADNGADVINMSLGGGFAKNAFPGFISLINSAFNYASSKGVTIVVSAGNDTLDLDHNGNRYTTYCDTPHVICVSATGPTSGGTVGPWLNVDNRAAYSNFGRSAVSFAAPGGTGGGLVWAACSKQWIVITPPPAGSPPGTPSTASRSTCAANPASNFGLGLGGTSMASPHVAGLAALLVERVGKDPGAVANAIKKSADDLGEQGTDPIYGKGRINVARALGL